MRFAYKDPNDIVVDHWFMLELWSERTSEETIRRICLEMPAIFEQDAAELFVPVMERDLDKFEIITESYLFIRSNDVMRVKKVRDVSGVQRILSEGDSERVRPHLFIKVENEYVQGLIAKCENYRLVRASKIKIGGFVRLLDGETRDYCGTVTAIDGDRAVVEVHLKSKIVIVETSIFNLLDISHIPEDHRVFFYSGPVQQYLDDLIDPDTHTLSEDTVYNEDAVKAFFSNDDASRVVERTAITKKHRSREQTPTRFAKSLIDGGEGNVRVILAKTVEAIRNKSIFSPKNSTTLWHALRSVIVECMFKGDPRIKTYSDIERCYGKEAYSLTPTDVIRAIPELPTKRGVGKVGEVGVEAKPTPAIVAPIVATRRTITSIVREALGKGDYNIRTLVPTLIQGMARNEVGAARHAEALYTAIRLTTLKHFKPTHPGVKVSTLTEIFGEDLLVTVAWLTKNFPELEETLSVRYDKQAPKLKFRTSTQVATDLTGIIRTDTVPPQIQGRLRSHPAPSHLI